MIYEQAKLQKAFEQVDAIFALEGFEPTAQVKAIDAALLAGKVTFPQVIDQMRDYAIKHKTTEGFIDTCDWA